MSNLTIYRCPGCGVQLNLDELETGKCLGCDYRFNPEDFFAVEDLCYECGVEIKYLSDKRLKQRGFFLCEGCQPELVGDPLDPAPLV